MRGFLHLFVIFALVTAGISPACKFINGSTIAEICAAWGIVEAKIPQPPIPFSLAASDETQDSQDDIPADSMKQPPCAFCFSKDNVKQAASVPVVLAVVEYTFKTSVRASSDAVIQKARREVYVPRGPPLFS